jgi:hypothetical protein
VNDPRLQKVLPGQRVRIPARTWNAFIDAARMVEQQQDVFGRQRVPRQADLVLVRNETGKNCPWGGIVGIAGPVITPKRNKDEFRRTAALRGVLPQAEHAGRFAVLREPLPDSALGEACLSGACVTRVEMADESHVAADVLPGASDRLRSAATGPAQLLWIEPVGQREDPQIAWVIARLGGGSTNQLWRARIIDFSGDNLHWIGRRVADDGSDLDTTDQLFYARRADPKHESVTADQLVPPYRPGAIGYVHLAPKLVDQGGGPEWQPRWWLTDTFTPVCLESGEPPPPPPPGSGTAQPPKNPPQQPGAGEVPPIPPWSQIPGQHPPPGDPAWKHKPTDELDELVRRNTGGRGCCGG